MTEHQDFAKLFDIKKEKLKLKKFVPASGAASRMFKFLTEFLNDFELENETIHQILQVHLQKVLSFSFQADFTLSHMIHFTKMN